MEDVKDTLWKWFVQLSAALGLCCSAYAAYCCVGILMSLPRTPPREAPGISPEFLHVMRAGLIGAGLLLGPMLGTVWFRMLLMRKWAAWVVCVLGAWLTLTSLAFMPRLVAVSALADRIGSGMTSSYLWRVLVVAYVLMLGIALIFRPKIWRDSM